jgi:hypothetical protein
LDDVFWVAFITASSAILSPLIPKWLSAREEKKKLKKDYELQFLEARRIAYHKFIQVFSAKYSGVSETYLGAALNAAEFGNVFLSQSIDFKNEKIATLDNLIGVIIRLRTEDRYEPVQSVSNDEEVSYYDEWGNNFETLRAKAALAFSPEFVEILLRKH